MFAYLKTKEQFIEDMTIKGETFFAEEITNAVIKRTGGNPDSSERKSWQNSLPVMSDILKDENIPDNAGIGIEYKFPTMPYRVDFMISGYDVNNQANVIIIELKQWDIDSVEAVPGKDFIVHAKTGEEWRYVSHPSDQSVSYADLISETNQAVEDSDIWFSPCVLLHNYNQSQFEPSSIFADQYGKAIEQAPIFVQGEEKNLCKYIKERIVDGDDAKILKTVEVGKAKTSKSLQKTLFNTIQNNSQEFRLLDDQKVVYKEIIHCVEKSMTDNKKRVVIVSGGPGTGKSVIAINLLAAFHSNGILCVYTSKNGSPRNYYINKLKEEGSSQTQISSMFQWSGSVAHEKKNSFKVILADEAHRLVDETKRDYYKRQYKNPVNEVEGIINAGLVSVFFIDQQQKISTEDIGTVNEILHSAGEAGADCYTITDKLTSQFRCNGSNGYIDWLDSTLQIKGKEKGKKDLKGVDYDFRVIDSPQELLDLIRERDVSGDRMVGSRIVAGYCWDWPRPQNPDDPQDPNHRNDPKYCEINNIPGYEDFEMSWNLEGYNSKYSYAYDKNSINQVGCIHTVQGLDFDYIGVIIGEDLKYENGKVVGERSKRASTDTTLYGIDQENDPDEVANTIIKNTYRVLMSRGLKGCYVFCVDKDLRNYLIERSRKD